MTSSTFPWSKPKNVYDSDGPSSTVIFDIDGITFVVTEVDSKGRDTGRKRYTVACVECDCIIHTETTGPSPQIRGHMVERHDFRGEIGHRGK
jgi:hypothetical protein